MSDTTLVGLKPGRNQSFQRSVMEGNVRKQTLVFELGRPIEIQSSAEFEAIADCIGQVLSVFDEDEDGQIRPCRESTFDTVVAIAKSKKKAKLRLTPLQKSELERSLRLEARANEESDLEELESNQQAILQEEEEQAEADRLKAEQADIKRLKEEIAEAKSVEKELAESMIGIQKQIVELGAKVSELEAEIVATEDEEDLKKLNEQLESFTADIANLEQDFSTTEIKRVESEISGLSKAIKSTVTDKKEVPKLKGQRTKLEKKVASLRASIA